MRTSPLQHACPLWWGVLLAVASSRAEDSNQLPACAHATGHSVRMSPSAQTPTAHQLAALSCEEC